MEGNRSVFEDAKKVSSSKLFYSARCMLNLLFDRTPDNAVCALRFLICQNNTNKSVLLAVL